MGILMVEAAFFRRWGCLLRGAVCSVLGGVGSLYLLNLLQGTLGFSVPLTAGTLTVSGVLGVPGTILLLMGRFFIQMG